MQYIAAFVGCDNYVFLRDNMLLQLVLSETQVVTVNLQLYIVSLENGTILYEKMQTVIAPWLKLDRRYL